jgi:hypothetical protein
MGLTSWLQAQRIVRRFQLLQIDAQHVVRAEEDAARWAKFKPTAAEPCGSANRRETVYPQQTSPA